MLKANVWDDLPGVENLDDIFDFWIRFSIQARLEALHAAKASDLIVIRYRF